MLSPQQCVCIAQLYLLGEKESPGVFQLVRAKSGLHAQESKTPKQLAEKNCTHETCKEIHQLNCLLEENVLEWLLTKQPREFVELESQFDKQELKDIRHTVQMDFFKHQFKN